MKIIESSQYIKLSKKARPLNNNNSEIYPISDPKGSPADQFWDKEKRCFKSKKKDIKDKDKTLKELLNKDKNRDPNREQWEELYLTERPPIF